MENYYDSSWPQHSDHSPHVSDYASFQYGEFHSLQPIEWTSEERAASASKNHSQAEKRRRDRINTQLANLRKLIPMSDKVNQFSFLISY